MDKQNNWSDLFSWMDANFINFMYYEGRMYDEMIEDGPSNAAFTKEFKEKARNFLYDIANSRKFDFYQKNCFERKRGM